jgi:hypothetical protein
MPLVPHTGFLNRIRIIYKPDGVIFSAPWWENYMRNEFLSQEKHFCFFKPVSFLILISIISTGFFASLNVTGVPPAQAHLDHLPHFNSGGNRYGYGDYISYISIEPEYGTTDYPSMLTFSVQDFDGNDIYNITTMVEIYDSISGNRIHLFPWTFRDIGDFHLYYQFPKKGGYQVVLSVRNTAESKAVNSYGQPISSLSTDPPRSILGDISNCDCIRTIFNISIATTFGTIQNTLFIICIVSPLILLGLVLSKNYYKKSSMQRSKSNVYSSTSDVRWGGQREVKTAKDGSASGKQIVRYSIMLLALAGGIVHLVVYPEHGSLHIYYSIFLLAASGGQIAYGILYFLVMLSKPFYEVSTTNEIRSIYLNNMAVNWFGFFGTAVLVGLYIYVLLYPPPLSPTNQPEEIEIAGVLAKSLEVALLIGIAFIIKWDRQKFHKMMTKVNQ